MGQLEIGPAAGDRFLIVDDHVLTARGIALALGAARDGAIVVHVTTIAAALEQLDGPNPFRLILLDYNLPDTAGFTGFAMLRAAAPVVPIVLVSASSDARLVDMAVALGALAFLSKCHPLDHFTMALRHLVEALPADRGRDAIPGRSRLSRSASHRDCATGLPAPHR